MSAAAHGRGGATAEASSSLRRSATVPRSSPMLRRPSSSAARSASSAAYGVAAQDVPGARDLQHHGGEAVPDEVVHVARDAPALGEHRLRARELAAGGVELQRQLVLARREGAPDIHGKAMPDDPDAGENLAGVLRANTHHGRRRRPRPEPSATAATEQRASPARATTKASSEASNISGSIPPSRPARARPGTSTAIDRASSGVLGT